MRLDAVRVRPVELTAAAASLFRGLSGMSVLVPADDEAAFEIGKSYNLSEGRERYRVLILEKHPTSIGVCVFLKKWDPS